MFDFKQIFIFKPDFGPVVVFLGLSPPSWASHVILMRCPDDSDQSGKVRIRALDSDPDTQQLILMRQCKIQMRMRTVRYGCGPGCRCRVRSLLLCGTAPYYGTGARADAWIRTSVRIRVSILKPGTASFLKLKCKKHTRIHSKVARIRFSSKNIMFKFF